MRLFRSREDSLRFGLSFFLILGAVLGSMFCNGMSEDMKKELQVLEQSMVTTATLSKIDATQLFMRVAVKRLTALLFAFLVSMTSVANVGTMLILTYLGFSAAVMVCALTMNAGLLGIWQYLLLVFPQCLLYVPAGYVILWWMPLKEKRLTVLSAIALVGLTALGALAESFVNPWFLTFL